MSVKEFQALTTYFGGIVNQLINEVGIAIPTISSQKIPAGKYKAIWDTGATNCVITSKIVLDLKMQPFSKKKVAGVHGVKLVSVYNVDVFLPSGVCITNIVAYESQKLVGDAEMLIGMDVISLGDFSVTQADGKTLMSYRTPSIRDIDYANEAKTLMSNLTTKNATKSQKQKNRELRALAKQNRKRRK